MSAMDLVQPLGLPRQRGRKSAASSAVPIDGATACLAPPSRQTNEERAVWTETVASVRAGWFRGSETALETFCRAVCIERRLAARLREITDPADERFRELVRLHRAEAMLVGNLTGKLRLTVRSTRDRETLKAVPRGPKPWDLPYEHYRQIVVCSAAVGREVNSAGPVLMIKGLFRSTEQSVRKCAP
jgi:hypothetical protein